MQHFDAIIEIWNVRSNNYAVERSQVSCVDTDYRLEAPQLNTIKLISYSITITDWPCLQDSSGVPTWLKWGLTTSDHPL